MNEYQKDQGVVAPKLQVAYNQKQGFYMPKSISEVKSWHIALVGFIINSVALLFVNNWSLLFKIVYGNYFGGHGEGLGPLVFMILYFVLTLLGFLSTFFFVF